MERQHSLWIVVQPMLDRVVLPVEPTADDPAITPEALVMRVGSIVEDVNAIGQCPATADHHAGVVERQLSVESAVVVFRRV